jgi:hypothetical protein
MFWLHINAENREQNFFWWPHKTNISMHKSYYCVHFYGTRVQKRHNIDCEEEITHGSTHIT